MTDRDGTGTQRDASTCVARFEVRYTRFLDADGNPAAPLPGDVADPAAAVPLYRHMVLTRAFDAKAIALQRTGQLGTYPSTLGQEGVATGIGAAMRADDVLLPSYRETGVQLWRGVTMTEILLYWGGDERGMAFEGPRRDFPTSVPVASHAPHAVGVAYAMAHRSEPRVAVCVLGDGGTSKGDFYEALNMAGVWKLPLVFVVNNNQWAISVPRQAQSRAETLAQKAIAAGFEGEQVDGNDVLAMRHCMAAALERARGGDGPKLIEALTYRLGDHTTSDDASRYRTAEELEARGKLDPVVRLRKYLVRNGAWSDADEETWNRECAERVEEAVRRYLDTPPQPPQAMFDYLFAKLPNGLEKQRAAVMSERRNDA